MRFGLILLVLLFAVAGALFGALNSQPVTFDFYFGSIELARGGALLAALLLGWMLGGLLVFVVLVVPLRGRLRRQARQLHQRAAADAAKASSPGSVAAGEPRP